MKYIIHSRSYTAEPARGGVIPMKGVENRRALFMKDTAAGLLARTDEWLSFEEVTKDMEEGLRKDWRDALTLLCCFDLAETEEEATPPPCRVAGERDYRSMAAFITENRHAGLSILPNLDAAYYSEDALRYRQFNNQQYHFLLEKDGKLLAILCTSVPGTSDLSHAAVFQSIVFSGELNEEESRKAFRQLVDHASEQFRGDLNKFRFALLSGHEGFLSEELPQMGFRQTAVLPKEVNDETDLILYDREIGG